MKFQAQCACGWKGKKRYTPLAARQDAHEHAPEGDSLDAHHQAFSHWVEEIEGDEA